MVQAPAIPFLKNRIKYQENVNAKIRKKEKTMQVISFPNLHLQFHISRIAIQIGNIKIYWYAIFIVLAIILALGMYKKQNGKYGIFFKDILNVSLWVLPMAFIGARLYYVLFCLEYFLKNPMEILNIQAGGLAIYGGILVGGLTIVIYSKKHKIDLFNLLDYIVPCIALGQAIGRWGNFINGEAHGITTDIFWKMGIIENGQYREVHPTFLYESLATLLLFFFLQHKSKHRKWKGEITAWYMVGYGIARIIIEGLRTDSLYLGTFRISQWVSTLLVIISSYWIYRKHQKRCQEFTQSSQKLVDK